MKRAFLNHTFRPVWSDRQGAFAAVAEMARGRGKRSTLVAACMLSALAGVSGSAQALDPGALPTGAQIVAGQGSVAQQGANMVVQQNTAAMIANWQSFNIGQNASVRFVQPSASAIALNRVLGSDPSQLFGQLSANGRVVLVNPNGVLFGSSVVADLIDIEAGQRSGLSMKLEPPTTRSLPFLRYITTVRRNHLALWTAQSPASA